MTWLRTRLTAGSPLTWDVVIAGLFALAGLTELALRGSFLQRDIALALFMTVPLAWRRRVPLASAVSVATAVAISGQTPTDLHLILAALPFAMYSLGAHTSDRAAVGGLAIALAALWISVAIKSTENAARDVISIAVLVGTAFAVGRALRGRELRLVASAERTAVLEREREEDVHRAASEERGRIARELHDVIAHGVTVMVVQAGAADQIIEQDPARAREALVAIQDAGRQALTDLRRLLGLVRDEDTMRLAPRPGLQELDALVDEMRKAGVPIEVEIRGTPRELPAGVDLSAFRIVQEALTNVLKHAGDARARVVVAYAPNSIELEVVDDGHAQTKGHGHGLVGMRERVMLYGGTLQAGPADRGGYRVLARLPLDGAM
ncbi:MAG: sensor histidine kinase [Chloroflexota bacterium]|nr:sensor histidine kinase [Chloroflexota bacterium]